MSVPSVALLFLNDTPLKVKSYKWIYEERVGITIAPPLAPATLFSNTVLMISPP